MTMKIIVDAFGGDNAPLEMIKGAREYYEYTKTLTKDEAYALNAEEGSKFREMVGLETPSNLAISSAGAVGPFLISS